MALRFAPRRYGSGGARDASLPGAGWLTDKLTCRRAVFAAAALLTGACFVAIPLVPRIPVWIDGLLFLSGAAQTLFAPVLGALALAGHDRLNRIMGANQAWNMGQHCGRATRHGRSLRVRAQLAFARCSPPPPVRLIRDKDLDERAATGMTHADESEPSWIHLAHNRTVLIVFISIFLFHFANAPILPTVALYVKRLGESDNLMTVTVLTAQLVMVPVALLAGRLCDSWGRKPVMGIAFWVLPLRILSYSLAASPSAVVWLQGLDGIGAGIYAVAVVALSSDLTKGKGGFNTLIGLFATGLSNYVLRFCGPCRFGRGGLHSSGSRNQHRNARRRPKCCNKCRR